MSKLNTHKGNNYIAKAGYYKSKTIMRWLIFQFKADPTIRLSGFS